MSDLSIHSGIYEHISEYSELIDMVLVELKSSPDNLTSNQTQLAELFKRLTNNSEKNFSERMFKCLLKAKCRTNIDRITEAGEKLLEEPRPNTLISDLEVLAKQIEQEQDYTFARIGGLWR